MGKTYFIIGWSYDGIQEPQIIISSSNKKELAKTFIKKYIDDFGSIYTSNKETDTDTYYVKKVITDKIFNNIVKEFSESKIIIDVDDRYYFKIIEHKIGAKKPRKSIKKSKKKGGRKPKRSMKKKRVVRRKK